AGSRGGDRRPVGRRVRGEPPGTGRRTGAAAGRQRGGSAGTVAGHPAAAPAVPAAPRPQHPVRSSTARCYPPGGTVTVAPTRLTIAKEPFDHGRTRASPPVLPRCTRVERQDARQGPGPAGRPGLPRPGGRRGAA